MIPGEHVDRFRPYLLGRLAINDHLYCEYCLQLSLGVGLADDQRMVALTIQMD